MAGVKGAMQSGQDVSDRATQLVDIDLCGYAVPALVAKPGSPLALEGADVLFLLCSAECAHSLRLAVVLDGYLSGHGVPADLPEIVSGLRLASDPQATGAVKSILGDDRLARVFSALERLETPPALHSCCAWCLRLLADDTLIRSVRVVVDDDLEWAERESGRPVVTIAGRPVPGFVSETRSFAAGPGDLGFMLCSQTGVDELTAAIDDDRRFSIVPRPMQPIY